MATARRWADTWMFQRRGSGATVTLGRELRFNIEVHTDTEVIGIDRQAHRTSARDLQSGANRCERYDALVLSPGAAPIRPPLRGVDRPGVFAIRNIPDSRRIRAWITERRPRKSGRRRRLHRLGDGREPRPHGAFLTMNPWLGQMKWVVPHPPTARTTSRSARRKPNPIAPPTTKPWGGGPKTM